MRQSKSIALSLNLIDDFLEIELISLDSLKFDDKVVSRVHSQLNFHCYILVKGFLINFVAVGIHD